MKKLSEYTSKDGKFVHQAKAGRYGGSKPDAEKPMRAPKAKDIKDIEKDDKKPELSDHPFKFKKKTEGVEESWSKGASPSNMGDRVKATQHKSDAKRSLDLAKSVKTDSSDHNKYMSDYHSSMAKHVKHAYHGAQYGSSSEAKADHKYHTDKAKEYKSKIKEGVDEKLVGNQHKLDHNKNGKLDADDFKKARAKKKGETATMNPKMDNGKSNDSMEQKEAVKSADKEPEEYTDPKTGKVKYRMVAKDKDMIKKESTIRQKLLSIFEKKDPHTKGAVSDPMGSNIKGAGAQKMVDDNKDDGRYNDLEKQSHDDASKAGRVTKPAANRPNDNKQGDKKVINPVDDITKKGQGSSEVKEETFMDKVVAYLRK